jgi:DNA end-binding protein Ku
VIQSLVGEFDPSELESGYRRDLRAMLESKLAGEEEVVVSEPVEEETPVIDLMDALRRSVADAQERKSPDEKPAGAKTSGSRRRAAARKSA